MCVYLHVCITQMHVRTCRYIHMCVCLYAHVYLITHTRTKTRTRVHVHERMCIYYTRTHTHTQFVILERGQVCSHFASVCAWVYVVRVGEYSG